MYIHGNPKQHGNYKYNTIQQGQVNHIITEVIFSEKNCLS